MKRHYFIIAAAFIGLIAASCSKNETSENNTADNAIGFGTYAGRTKADTDYLVDGSATTNIPNGKSIGMFGYVLNGTTWAASGSTAVPTLFNNVQVTAASSDGSTFTYSPARYWPTSTSYKLSFYAYYPYGGAGITPSVTSGMGSYAFETQAAAANQVDFMMSNLAADQSKAAGNPSDGSVDLTFHHLLCQVKATAAASAEMQANPAFKSCTITKIEILGVNSKGTLTPSCPSATTTFAWTGQNTTANYTAGDPSNNENLLLLMPQSIPATATIRVTYDIVFNYSADKNDTSKDVPYAGNVKTATLSTTAVSEWLQNKIYNYTIGVSLDKIEFTSTVTNWETGSSVSD
jgi:hypothetical protein